MDIDWPVTNIGINASAPCPCAEFAGSLAGRAYRYCNGTYSQGVRWEEKVYNDECDVLNSPETRRLCDAAKLLAKVLRKQHVAESNVSCVHTVYMLSGCQ